MSPVHDSRQDGGGGHAARGWALQARLRPASLGGIVPGGEAEVDLPPQPRKHVFLFRADHCRPPAIARLVPAADLPIGVAQMFVDRRFGRFELHGLFQRSEEHTYELQSLMRISYAVFCLKKKKKPKI